MPQKVTVRLNQDIMNLSKRSKQLLKNLKSFVYSNIVYVYILLSLKMSPIQGSNTPNTDEDVPWGYAGGEMSEIS